MTEVAPEPIPTWQGEDFRRASRILFIAGLLGLFISVAARSALVMPFLVGLPLLAGTVLFVLSTTARREQVRRWDEYQAGRASTPTSPVLTALVIGFGLLVPPAILFGLRIPLGRGVVNIFGLPWPSPIHDAAIITCIATAAVGALVVLLGHARAETRSVSSAVLLTWAILSPFLFLIFFLSIYGDPGSDAGS